MTHRSLFYILPAITMSLGWALRGTIGGGPVGAMIPGVMVTLCLCHLTGWNRRVGIAAALGTIGVGLGGQVTYGQTIGFARFPETMLWGELGMTIKGAMWGLSGGVLVGLGLMHSRYKPSQILIGLILMLIGTAVGHLLVDEPKLLYFSDRVNKPREEIWFGLTLGALCLVVWLLFLGRERVSPWFALFGMLGGAAGFGGGGLFFVIGSLVDESMARWPWWKMKEFTFGLLYGLGLGVACDLMREAVQQADQLSEDATDPPNRPTSFALTVVAGVAVVFAGMFFQFTIPYRAMFSVVGAALIGISLYSIPLAWHVAVSMTVVGFLRDFLYKFVQVEWFNSPVNAWATVFLLTVLVVAVVTLAVRNRVSARDHLLVLTWIATVFGLIKTGVPEMTLGMHWFVPGLFVVEAVLVTAMLATTPATAESQA
ncbi:MAG: hypothetical protein KDA86_17530 [Planctomycetaceae bacterium]|nr:hypothetical protein [Planctomycetaceae bacterium]